MSDTTSPSTELEDLATELSTQTSSPWARDRFGLLDDMPFSITYLRKVASSRRDQ